MKKNKKIIIIKGIGTEKREKARFIRILLSRILKCYLKQKFEIACTVLKSKWIRDLK
jgi:hypothetical protein